MAYVNHQGASGPTRGQQGTTLLAVYIPRGENVAADASLWIRLSQQNDPRRWIAHSLFQSINWLQGCNNLQHFRAQIMGQIILVRFITLWSWRMSNTRGHPVGPGGTKGLLCRWPTSQKGRCCGRYLSWGWIVTTEWSPAPGPGWPSRSFS